MGLGKAPANILLQEGRRRPLEGRLLTLGKQDIWVSLRMLQDFSAQAGTPLRKAERIELSSNPELAKLDLLSDRSFFELLGFSGVESLDNSDYEGADHIVDLNDERMPDHLLESFDFIIDGGTLEHVFHLPNALNNIFCMLKRGGRILHMSPSSNHMDHGFHMFSPTFFMDFYFANKFEINQSLIYRHTKDHFHGPWEVSEYQPGSLDAVSFGGLDDGIYGIAFLATKTRESTGDVIPQQGVARPPKQSKSSPEGRESASLARNFRTKVASIPFARPVWRFVRMLVAKVIHPKKGLRLRVKARY